MHTTKLMMVFLSHKSVAADSENVDDTVSLVRSQPLKMATMYAVKASVSEAQYENTFL